MADDLEDVALQREDAPLLVASFETEAGGASPSNSSHQADTKQAPPHEPSDHTPPPSDAARARWAIYGSHFLSMWGQRMWEFAVGLAMLSLYPRSLAWVAAAGLLQSGANVLLGTHVGLYMDRWVRVCGSGWVGFGSIGAERFQCPPSPPPHRAAR